MRVVYLNPCGEMGGAELSLLDVISSMCEAEPDWHYSLVLSEDGPLAEQARSAGADVIIEPFPRALARLGDSGNGSMATLRAGLKAAAGTWSYTAKLRKTLSRLNPDIVHTNGFKMHVLGAWAHPKNVPVIWHVRDYVSTRPVMKGVLSWCADRATAAIGNSYSVAKDIQKVCGNRLETVCIYNAIDLKRYCPAGDKLDLDALAGMAPAPEQTVRLGLVATLAHWKGHEVFLRALARIPKEVRYRAYVVGGAIYQTHNSQRTLDELRMLAAELGVSDRVGFTGYVGDSAGAIRALDVLVHASTQPEPFGRVIAEGMACGRAVIASAAGGAAELISEGRDALAHAPGDDAALAGRMTELIKDGELRARLGRTARITAERKFERKRLAEQLTPIYKRLAGIGSLEPAGHLAGATGR